MAHNESELGVITKAKELWKYIFTVTQKSPKQFRFTFTGRMQNLVLSIMENLIRANDTILKKEDVRHAEVNHGDGSLINRKTGNTENCSGDWKNVRFIMSVLI